MQKPTTLAMMLAGGEGDELSVLTNSRPKSAVPFGGCGRVIDFPLSNLMNSGIEQVAILSQYYSYSLIKHIGTGAAWDMLGRYRGVEVLPPHIKSDRSASYRGSADAVYKNLDYLHYHSPENILVLSGDDIYQMDYQKMIDFHNEQDADLTMGVMKVKRGKAEHFGVAAIDDDNELGGRVSGYWNKLDEALANWASLPVLCFKPEKLYKYLQLSLDMDLFGFGSGIIPLMVNAGEKVYGYQFSGYWGSARTVEEFWQSNMDLLGDEPIIDTEAWGMRTNLEHREIKDLQPTLIGDGASISNSLIYNDCKVLGTVRNSILFPGVEVDRGSVVENSVLFFNNVLGKNCCLNRVISDVNSSFGDDVILGADVGAEANTTTLIGQNNTVPSGAVVGEGATVFPGLKEGAWAAPVGSGQVLI